MNGHKLGLTLGSFAGLVHLVWVILVALGIAQPLADWTHKMHFLESSYAVMPFSAGGAIGLVLLALVVGYIVGRILAAIWNWVNR